MEATHDDSGGLFARHAAPIRKTRIYLCAGADIVASIALICPLWAA
jgi:hypothetical protein